MKRNYLYFVIVVLSWFSWSCSDDHEKDDPAATLTPSVEQVELANTANSTAIVELSSNQSVFTVTISDAAKSWCSAFVSGTTVTVKAISENPDPSVRTATITVVAGQGENRVTRTFQVLQAAADADATLSLSAEEVTLASSANSTAIVEATSNQTTFQVMVDQSAAVWFSVSVTENVLLITALSENTSDETRIGVITVLAGSGDNMASQELTVNQLAPVVSLIGQVVEGGVVFWQDPDDPKKCKIVSAIRLEGEAWCPQEIEVIATGANSEDDGLANTNLIKALANFNQYTAARYCTEMGDGWYLPSKNEALALFEAYNGTKTSEATLANPDGITAAEKTARAAFDAALTSFANGVAMNTAADNAAGNSIWSSTEHATDPTKVYWVRFGKYAIDAGVKRSTARTVRAVKRVTID